MIRFTPIIWMAATCGAAHASHIVFDWLGTDSFAPAGVQALWPFSDRFFISGWDVFARIERRHPLEVSTIVSNLKAVVREMAILTPVVGATWMFWRCANREKRARAAEDSKRPGYS
jgi:hypothetical protein